MVDFGKLTQVDFAPEVDEITVIRVIRYTGDRAAVTEQLRRSLQGELIAHPTHPVTKKELGAVRIEGLNFSETGQVSKAKAPTEVELYRDLTEAPDGKL